MSASVHDADLMLCPAFPPMSGMRMGKVRTWRQQVGMLALQAIFAANHRPLVGYHWLVDHRPHSCNFLNPNSTLTKHGLVFSSLVAFAVQQRSIIRLGFELCIIKA